MNIVDLILLGLLSLFALRGFFKGLFRESFSLVGLFIGFMVAVHYDEPVAALWSNYWKFSPVILKAIIFVVLLFVVYFTFSLAGWLLHRSARFLFLQGVNRVGGIVLGVGKGAAILALIIFLVSPMPWMPQKMRQRIDESYLVPPLYQFARALIWIGKANLLPREKSQTHTGEGFGIF
ncbi:MAG: CvpA family protein [Candidatus Binatia bacterium]